MDLGDLKYLDAPAKVLKLSTAMRIGATIRPQANGHFFIRGRSCAIGAAYEGATGKQTIHYRPIFDLWPALEGSRGLSELAMTIANKNDHGESRECIATWLESKGY